MAIAFHYLFPLQKRVLQKHNNSLSPVELSFCKRWKGLPPANFSYDTSVHFQQPWETKSEGLRKTVMQLGLPWIYVLLIISCWLLTHGGEAIGMPSENTHMVGSACEPSLPHSICPLRRLREKKWRDFCVSLLSLILITRELFCKISSIFP